MKINEFILLSAIMDCLTDIDRVMMFHKIDNPNLYKIYAYETYWLIARKPIQVVIDGALDKGLLYINERFALDRVFGFLMSNYDKDDIEETKTKSEYGDKELSEKTAQKLRGYIADLTYHFEHRILTPQMMEIVFMSFNAGIFVASSSKGKAYNKEK